MLPRRYLIAFLVAGSLFLTGGPWAQEAQVLHPELGKEGIYDPETPALLYLQQPASALAQFPSSAVGNHVNWVKALNEGHIEPRMGLAPDQFMRPIDMDVRMTETASMPYVTFPHFQHTQWLACSNCHTEIFLPKRGANPVNMYAILQGEYCGVCHGKVAFPVTDCFRCHDTPQDRRMLPQ